MGERRDIFKTKSYNNSREGPRSDQNVTMGDQGPGIGRGDGKPETDKKERNVGGELTWCPGAGGGKCQ